MKGFQTEGIDVKEHNINNEEMIFKSIDSLSFVYVKEGRGTLEFGNHYLKFSRGKLFIIPKDETYIFKSNQSTLICIQCSIEFIDRIRLEADRIESCENLYKLQYISHNYHARAGCVFQNLNDENFAEMLIIQIANEFKNKAEDYLIIRNCLSILLNIIARNIILHEASELQENQKAFSIMRIIAYIQQHIKDREKTSIATIAKHFGISKNYFGQYFKEQTGLSYQNYLMDYRFKLVETYLKYSNKHMSEIAFELQFSDESHLSKNFKKYKGVTPGQFRKQFNEA